MKTKSTKVQIFASDLLDIERDEARIDAIVDRHTERVVVDIAELAILDVGRMRSLVALLRRSRAHGIEFSVRTSHEEVRRQLALTGLDRILEIDGDSAA
ncbi:MAG: STAS domain-containing protein [Candidatus Eremiobacteraeota bacterium]|nr:STAS domain-containing protein [Candidatus Eremiobacteraeota bacterium]